MVNVSAPSKVCLEAPVAPCKSEWSIVTCSAAIGKLENGDAPKGRDPPAGVSPRSEANPPMTQNWIDASASRA